MARKVKSKTKYGNDSNGATLGFEATMWAAADKMRHTIRDAETRASPLHTGPAIMTGEPEKLARRHACHPSKLY